MESGRGAVTGEPRAWLRAEGLVAFVASLVLYGSLGGSWLLLIPLLFLPDVSMVGYLRGPALGATLYNVAHSWATGVLVLGVGAVLRSPELALAGAVLTAHTGMDRAAGYGLKYPSAFHDTHLGRIGPRQRGQRGRAAR